MVACKDAGLRIVLHDDEHTAIGHEIDIGTQYVDQLNGLLHHYTFGDVDEEAILCQQGVEGGDSILFGASKLAIMTGHELGVLGRELLEAAEDDSVGQGSLRQGTIVEGVVHHEVERGAHVGHVALEHVVGIDGDVEATNIESVVGCKERLHIGILVVLDPLRGEARLLQMAVGLIAQRIHHIAAMACDELAALAVEGEVLSRRPAAPLIPPKGG